LIDLVVEDESAGARAKPTAMGKAVRIAVDAMGGDQGPGPVVEGALTAARDMGLAILLVGDRERIGPMVEALQPRLAPRCDVDVIHAAETIGMDEAPAEAVRRKPDASIRVAFQLAKDGRADAVVSAGHSGATLAIGRIVLGKIPGLERPGIAGFFPSLTGRTILIDIGANVDCRPVFLLQFGLMAEVLAAQVFKIERPQIGLLSIGQEDNKGNDLVLRAHDLLKAGVDGFIGNVEGRDLFSGRADVVVCDGFVGNVALKISEGLAETSELMLKRELRSDWASRLGSWLSHGAMRRFKRKVDYAEVGGAPLLGLNGVSIISHGASSPRAIKNAVKTAADMARADLPQRLTKRLAAAQTNA
jgi:glycerol-3-phosphate acyltransferase PlsX